MLNAASGFRLDPTLVDDRHDLVVVGNPTNPTSTLHPSDVVRALRRPGRVVMVDEAFLDAVPGSPETLIAPDMSDVLVLRSLTKTWGLAGVRAGYVVGDPALVARLADAQRPWAVGAPALTVLEACATPTALAEVEARAVALEQQRHALVRLLRDAGLEVAGSPRGTFVLVRARGLRDALAQAGIVVRDAGTFPGLDDHWARIAVPDLEGLGRLGQALAMIKVPGLR